MKRAAFVVLYSTMFILLFMLWTAPKACGEDVEVSVLRGAGANVVEVKYTEFKWEPYILSQIRSRPAFYEYRFTPVGIQVVEKRDDFSWGLGVDYRLFETERTAFRVGLVWLARTNRMNGTHLNSHFELTHNLSNEMSLSISHISHGSKFGIEPDKPNKGWNFVGLTWRF